MINKNNFTSAYVTLCFIIMITMFFFVMIYLTKGYYACIKMLKLVSVIAVTFLSMFFIKRMIDNKKIKEEEQREQEEKDTILATMDRVKQKLEDDIEIYQGPVEQRIQKIDKNFLKEDFNQFSKMIFMKLMQAFNKRDYKEIKLFESKELFEQHRIEIHIILIIK